MTVRSAGGGTEIDLVLDVASAETGPSLLAEPERSLLLALYQDGRLVSAAVRPFAVTLDANGIAQAAVSAELSGGGDTLRIFLLGEGGGLVPLSEPSFCELEVAGA